MKRPTRRPLAYAAVGILAGGSLAGLAAGTEVRGAVGELVRREAFWLRVIAVRGAQRLSAREVAAAAGVAPATPLVDVDPRRVEERLREQAWIASARALRLPRGTLILSVSERVPRAVAAAGERGALHFVDAGGVAFAPAPAGEADALPRIRRARPAAPGRADPQLARAVAVTSALDRLGFAPPIEVRISAPGNPEGLVLRLPALAADIVLGHGDPPAALTRLAHLVAIRPREALRASHIDLRFADRVVLRSQAVPKGRNQRRPRASSAAPSRAGPHG